MFAQSYVTPLRTVAQGFFAAYTQKQIGSSSDNAATDRERLLRRPNELSNARVH